jgi:hypothetical protein
MKVLNLYACLGGNRLLWDDCEVTAVELDEELARLYQERFPNDKVIVAEDKAWCESNLGGTWVQTSYNTYGGEHKLGGTPLNKNYAAVGYTWDGTGFARPKPYPSWSLNSTSYLWEAPTPMPTENKHYSWNEATTSWIEDS